MGDPKPIGPERDFRRDREGTWKRHLARDLIFAFPFSFKFRHSIKPCQGLRPVPEAFRPNAQEIDNPPGKDQISSPQ
jgi:hypothetical protein